MGGWAPALHSTGHFRRFFPEPSKCRFQPPARIGKHSFFCGWRCLSLRNEARETHCPFGLKRLPFGGGRFLFPQASSPGSSISSTISACVEGGGA
jgi:hypothetical protein